MKNKVKMPTKSTLKNRKTTMNNAFVYLIMPWEKITEEEYKNICKKLMECHIQKWDFV